MHGRIYGVVRVPTVEVWINGVRFISDCASDEAARALVLSISVELGLAP